MGIIAGFMVPHPPLIIEEVGNGREKIVEKTIDSYLKVAEEINKLEPETIIISSPHAVLYSDYFHLSSSLRVKGSMANFGADDVTFDEEVDLELVEEISKIALKYDFLTGMESRENELDHGSMVPLYFIRKYLRNYKVIIVGLAGLSFSEHYKLGMIIKEAVANLDRRVVYVASGDLSHKLQEDGPYGFTSEGPIYDNKIMNIMGNGNFLELLNFDNNLREKASECGHRSFIIMAGVFDGIRLNSKIYSHEDKTGVGYGIISFYPIEEDNKRCFLNSYLDIVRKKCLSNDNYVNIAKKAIENYLKTGKIIDSSLVDDSSLLLKKRGVFVSIFRENNLRGCIGTIYSVRDNIILEIISNAISAATNDNRFIPIEEWELPYLEIHVDEIMEIEDINSKRDLDIKKYGVIVSSGEKRGVLLPDLEGVDSVDEQIRIARIKGDIEEGEDFKIQRFGVIRHI